jgi:uncharacterized membrane protein YfcA
LNGRQPFRHAENKDRYAQRCGKPESSSHIDKFRIHLLLERNHFRLERHAALWTSARPTLTHLRVHGTGVDAFRNFNLRMGNFQFDRREKLLRIRLESITTAGIAEVVRLSFVVVLSGGGFRHDVHVTYRIDLEEHSIHYTLAIMFGWAGLLLIGFAVGAIGTLIGAGGGFLLVPVLLLLNSHFAADTVAGISLAVVFFNAASGTLAYARMRRIDYKAGIIFALAALPGAVLGAYTTSHIPRRVFDGSFGLLLVTAAVYLVATAGHSTDGSHSGSYNLWLGVVISAGVGFLSSLLGIGGGIIHVPALTHALNFPVHTATATSHFVLSITALVATLIHLRNGALNGQLQTIAWLSIGAIAGAQAGAKLSNRVGGPWILRSLAIGLGLVGIRILLVVF